MVPDIFSLRWLVSVPWNKAKCVRREDIILTTWEKLREKTTLFCLAFLRTGFVPSCPDVTTVEITAQMLGEVKGLSSCHQPLWPGCTAYLVVWGDIRYSVTQIKEGSEASSPEKES